MRDLQFSFWEMAAGLALVLVWAWFANPRMGLEIAKKQADGGRLRCVTAQAMAIGTHAFLWLWGAMFFFNLPRNMFQDPFEWTAFVILVGVGVCFLQRSIKKKERHETPVK